MTDADAMIYNYIHITYMFIEVMRLCAFAVISRRFCDDFHFWLMWFYLDFIGIVSVVYICLGIV